MYAYVCTVLMYAYVCTVLMYVYVCTVLMYVYVCTNSAHSPLSNSIQYNGWLQLTRDTVAEDKGFVDGVRLLKFS